MVGYVAGGLPGSRLLNRLSIPVGDDTVLRELIRGDSSNCSTIPVRHLGVDDWAWKKGQNYGTILVDLDQHRVVDLLPGRSADELRRWLQQHSGIEVITRDRCGLYAEGATAGAPTAVQVADRFHLLVNLSGAVERVLEGCSAELKVGVTASTSTTPDSPPVSIYTQPEIRSQQRRLLRLERYENVLKLHRAGHSQKAIAELLNIERKTIRRWLRADQFPERKKPVRRPARVEEHSEYLRKRWDEGCHNATALHQEIRKRGYTGGRSMVARHVSDWRKRGISKHLVVPKRITPKQAAILACKRSDQLSAEQQQLYSQVLLNCPTLGLMQALAQDFRGALFGKDSGPLKEWIRTARQSGIGQFVRFAFGLEKDLPAVNAAVETGWSNGQVEGQVNRLKTIKRQMYGRAGFHLLRSRVLLFVPSAPP